MARKTETKDFKFTLTDVDEQKGTFKGYASIWNTIDSYGDQVQKGAFKKSLREAKSFPMLWSHNIHEPIGVIAGAEDQTGLAVEGALNLEVQRARETRALMAQMKDAGAPMGLSIGYQTVVEEIDKATGTRKLKEIKLWEISPVIFQACPGAIVADVKADEPIRDGRPWLLEPAEAKPYPNEHACRLQEPDRFTEMRRGTRKHEGKEYSVIYGKPKDGDGWEEQAYRYAKDVWTATEAKAHCKDHDGSFEAASNGKYCDECRALLELGPEKSTPAPEPHSITTGPDTVHPAEKLRDTIAEIHKEMTK